ncbi:MAG: glucose-6-phosphate dehydrogenase [Planctomycetia bacterium]|nr:glucose-6-phosphate dehydrogenase [Planctomycetia bacterium]
MERKAIVLVIFGASGDLTSRKLIPALAKLEEKGWLPKVFRVVGISRTRMTDEQWREKLAAKFSMENDSQKEAWKRFSEKIHYYAGDVTDTALFPALDKFLSEKAASFGIPAERIYYLATSPVFYESIAEGLRPLVQAQPSCRMVVEKPFGTDFETARALNEKLHEIFPEESIFRMDHYLGKETAQNIMVLRFANAIFEPLWNRNYIEKVEITALETSLVGRRLEYYNEAGILRDMFQNHLLQLLTLVAMEPPTRWKPEAIRNEKVKVLQGIRPMEYPYEIQQNSFLARYDGGEPELLPQTATYARVSLQVDNWRWKGVPFLLTSGKGMPSQKTEIGIHFRPAPHILFDREYIRKAQAQDPQIRTRDWEANTLLLQIHPEAKIILLFQSKVPDTEKDIRQTQMQFDFTENFQGELPEAYERLLLDAIEGNPNLFPRGDEIEYAWKIIDPIQRFYEGVDLPRYPMFQANIPERGTN